MKPKPRPVIEYDIFNGIYYYNSSCPYLKDEPESVNKDCSLLQQQIDFYYWHIARCQDEDE